MSTDFRLITIPISHYCEKARWALEYLQIPFQEFAQMPPFHQIPAKQYGGTTLPILITGTRIIRDSTEILRYLDTLQPGKLYPTEPELHRLGTELETLELLRNKAKTAWKPVVSIVSGDLSEKLQKPDSVRVLAIFDVI